ncbi:MAG TPA: acyl-CoA dehydrogenase family protein [Thermoanaerobaculia bacterium]|nr:acyl-CoA dehydrogenase family protein [Thermoanaerobaculia bacterium]
MTFPEPLPESAPPPASHALIEIELPPEHRELVARTAELARERFVPRADRYDRAAEFPRDDFDDLFAAGLLAPTVPRAHGGLGVGPLHGAAFALWMMTKEIAKADLALARCWEGHANSLVLLDGIAGPAQRERWFAGVVERGEVWAAWSGEPPAAKPGEGRFGTSVERVAGGYLVRGSKVFATSSTGADWAILLCNTAGPGGARHATASPESLLLLACRLADPTVSVDGSWWDPIGMRATASHLVRFDSTFVPDDQVIGAPGRYLAEGWQTRFIPHYAASFLGAAEAALGIALEQVAARDRGADPYVQHRTAKMSIDVDTAHLWLLHVARLWEEGRADEAAIAGSRARWLIEHLAEDTVHHAIRVCGARSLNRPSPLERILRDLTFYLRHDSDDQILATVGRSLLGLTHDASFYKP